MAMPVVYIHSWTVTDMKHVYTFMIIIVYTCAYGHKFPFMSYTSDYDKLKAISLRVSKNDLEDFQLIIDHLDKDKRWKDTKRADAIWAGVRLYKEKHKLTRGNEG